MKSSDHHLKAAFAEFFDGRLADERPPRNHPGTDHRQREEDNEHKISLHTQPSEDLDATRQRRYGGHNKGLDTVG